MLKSIVSTIAVTAFAAGIATAQTKPAAADKVETTRTEAAAAKAPAEPAPAPVNIKIEVSITDQSGSGTPAKKVVSMIAGDRQSTNIRSSASVPVVSAVFGKAGSENSTVPMQSFTYRNVTINVDARPVILPKEPNRISLSLGLEYIPRTEGRQEETAPGMASWKESLGLILESGKPMVVSQAADPTSDRKITVEVTATILK
jgi:hypothetical protein